MRPAGQTDDGPRTKCRISAGHVGSASAKHLRVKRVSFHDRAVFRRVTDEYVPRVNFFSRMGAGVVDGVGHVAGGSGCFGAVSSAPCWAAISGRVFALGVYTLFGVVMTVVYAVAGPRRRHHYRRFNYGMVVAAPARRRRRKRSQDDDD